MSDINITIVSGETTEIGLSIPGVQGPIGGDTMPSGGSAGQILVKQSSADYDAAWTAQASGLTLTATTLSGTTVNVGTVSGGTIATATITGSTIANPTITSGTANGTALSNAIIDNCTIDNSTIEDTVLSSVTISGTISAGSGLVLGGASDVLAFYGTSAVVQPSGIAIPSGGSTVSEVLVALSGVIVALSNLGLLGP